MADKSTTQEDLQKLNTQLECSLCLDTYKEPKLLPCFHVFCKSPCLEKLVAKDGQSLQCPTCEHLVPLPANGISGLQSDFHIDNLFEIRDAFNRAAKSNETQCGSCEDGKATGYCQDCEQFVCNECQAAHRRLKITNTHHIITLDEVQAQATKLIPPKKAVPRCTKHSNKKLKIYCETCEELICSDCTIRVHRDHNYDLVVDVFPKHKEEIISSLKPVREKLETVLKALQAFDTRAKEISENKAIVEADINGKIDQQQRFLDQQRVELVGKVDMLTQQKLKSLKAQKDQVKNIKLKLTSCLEYTEGGLETGTEGEVLAMMAPVSKCIEHINAEFDPETIQPKTKADTQLLTDGRETEELQTAFKECFKILDSESVSAANNHTTVDGLTGAEVNKKATTELHVMTKDNKSYNGRVDVTAEITHCESQTATKCRVEKKDDRHEISYRPRNRGKHMLIITVNGRQVNGSPFAVAVSPSQRTLGKPVRVIELTHQPWGITINSKGHYIITEYSGDQVTVFNSGFRKIYSFGSRGSSNGQLNCPRGVAVNGDDNIYVCDQINNRIQKFTANGQFMSSVGTEGSGVLQFDTPGGIGYNKTNGKLYVCDQNNHRIQVLNTDLSIHRSLGKYGEGDGEFDVPVGVCFDTAGNVYIAEYGNNRVQVFTTEGEFLQKFGSGKLKGPLHVAISSTGVMYVSEQTANRISMFTLTGEFIRSFGRKGQREGQFDVPVTVIIDEDANIVVTDMNNDRVQIF